MLNGIKKAWVHTQWAASAIKGKTNEGDFWAPIVMFPVFGVIISGLGYAILGMDFTERAPRKHTDFDAAKYNLVSSVKFPKSLCPDLEGNIYFAAKNDQGEYVITERVNGAPTFSVPDEAQQSEYLQEIKSCLKRAGKQSPEELLEYGDDFKFSTNGAVYGPLYVHDEKTGDTKMVYDFSASDYFSYKSLEDEVSAVQQHLMIGGEELITTERLSQTWERISDGVEDKGYASYDADNLPTASYTPQSWSGAFTAMGWGSLVSLTIGLGFGICTAESGNSAARRKKYQAKLNSIGRDAIM